MSQTKKNRITRRPFRTTINVDGIPTTIIPSQIPDEKWTPHHGEWDGQPVNSIYSCQLSNGQTILKTKDAITGKTSYMVGMTNDFKLFGEQFSRM